MSSDAVQIRADDGSSSIALKPDGQIDIATPGAINIAAAGEVNFTATVNITGDVVLNGISLKDHVHIGVTEGTANSGGPTNG